ncbi:MAG TPA: hypothetical protein VHM25_06425 [Polyangiaceae bacterium]|jgi:hypothetical protein|nr:hypothetical protein [Polyangiaceae bacterium]
MKMWRPVEIGDVIAQRSFDLVRQRKTLGRVSVSFGRPVQEPTPDEHAPWFCPVAISGAGMERFIAIGGVDALQALVLALEFATSTIPLEAARMGARAEWLHDDERIILARHVIALGADNALIALLGRLKQASALLDVGTSASGKARTRAIDALNAIGASVGGRIASKRPSRKGKRAR